jgi:endonuclease VIII
MPEGDTVWNTARLLHGALAGQTVLHSDLRVPAVATVDLAGWIVDECVSRGKHLLLRLHRPVLDSATPPVRMTLHSHLRMDGSWRIFSPGEPWHGRPGHLIRVVLRAAAATAIGYHLHDLAVVAMEAEAELVGHLGPDLLGPSGAAGGWDPLEAIRRLSAQPDRPIGEALIDQRCLAGIGNLYRAEVLYLRGIHPDTPIGTVADLPAVVDLAHRLLVANRGRWTQATTGSLRRGEEVYVYGRAGAPCRRCGALIARRQLDGERVTYWCPRCQPAPADSPTLEA